jgi:hypothetical protein
MDRFRSAYRSGSPVELIDTIYLSVAKMRIQEGPLQTEITAVAIVYICSSLVRFILRRRHFRWANPAAAPDQLELLLS